MDLAEKKRHLLRRFGFGASLEDQKKLEKLNLDQAIQLVLRTDGKDIGHPYQYTIREKEEPDAGSWRFRAFWFTQMMASETPFREKMALFWHSHFAVSDGKVEHGPMMHDYMQALRTDPAGNFDDILRRMVKTPALLKTLDVRRLMKGRSNENFAREVMELYTLGIGNYSEADIKEVARALTGWSYEDIWYGLSKTDQGRVDACAMEEMPAATFAYMPDVRDTGQKSILGKRGDFDGDQMLDLLAKQPQTAKFICGKLWSFFGSSKPEPKVIERMAKAMQANKLSIRSALVEMTKCPEFWSDAVVGKMIKPPVDFTIGYARAMNAESLLKTLIEPNSKPNDMIAKRVFDAMSGLAWNAEMMGQNVLWPPTVAGWDGHEAWISSNNMLRRRNYQGLWLWVQSKKDGKAVWGPGQPSIYLLAKVRESAPKTPTEVVDALCRVMDASLTAEQKAALVQRVEKSGGMKNTEKDESYLSLLGDALNLMRMAPDFHLC